MAGKVRFITAVPLLHALRSCWQYLYPIASIAMRRILHRSATMALRCRTAGHLLSSVFALVMDSATYRQVRYCPALSILLWRGGICSGPRTGRSTGSNHVSRCGSSTHIATFRSQDRFARLHRRRRFEGWRDASQPPSIGGSQCRGVFLAVGYAEKQASGVLFSCIVLDVRMPGLSGDLHGLTDPASGYRYLHDRLW